MGYKISDFGFEISDWFLQFNFQSEINNPQSAIKKGTFHRTSLIDNPPLIPPKGGKRQGYLIMNQIDDKYLSPL